MPKTPYRPARPPSGLLVLALLAAGLIAWLGAARRAHVVSELTSHPADTDRVGTGLRPPRTALPGAIHQHFLKCKDTNDLRRREVDRLGKDPDGAARFATMKQAMADAERALRADPRLVEEVLDCLGEDPVLRDLALRLIAATPAECGAKASPYLLRMLEQLMAIVPQGADDTSTIALSMDLRRALGAVGLSERAAAMLRTALRAPPVPGPVGETYRLRQLQMLTDLHPVAPETALLLTELLSSPDASLRGWTAQHLVSDGPAPLRAVQILVELLEMPDPGHAPSIRSFAVNGLMQASPKAEAALPWLTPMLSDPSAAKRRIAARDPQLRAPRRGGAGPRRAGRVPRLVHRWFEQAGRWHSLCQVAREAS